MKNSESIFLEDIRDHVMENNIEVKWADKKEIKGSFRAPDDGDKRESKIAAPKEKTYEITAAMIKEGKSLKEISLERNLTNVTILGHIEKYVQEGVSEKLDITFEEFFNEEEEIEIINAADKVGIDRLTPIKNLHIG